MKKRYRLVRRGERNTYYCFDTLTKKRASLETDNADEAQRLIDAQNEACRQTALLTDPSICAENRQLFDEFFQFEEYKLKRMRGNPTLDDNSYKTLLAYASRLRTVNRWFSNQAWRSLTKADIQRVYDDLEDGKVTTQRGTPVRDKGTYYRHIIRGKPFEMAGKKELVKEVLQFGSFQDSQEVRFITEQDFRRILEFVHKPNHRLFLWLCWDIGENAHSILSLRARDCREQQSDSTTGLEYLVNLRKELLKRSRRSRSELTNYKETADALGQHLKSLSGDDLLFEFGEGAARKMFLRAAQQAGVRCIPAGQRVTLKDLRSSMACDLLSKGWSLDEVNARLGHAPGSREIRKYANYLAIDRTKPKQKFQENQITKLATELTTMRNREKLLTARLEQVQRSSGERDDYLNRLIAIQSRIAILQIARLQGKMDEQEFARALVKQYNELARHRGQEPSAKNSDSARFAPAAESNEANF